MAYLFNQCLSDTPMCEHWIDSVEDAHHYFFTCPKYTKFRDVLCQTIQNIFECDHIFDLDLLLYGSPDHGLHFNTQTYIYRSYKTLYLTLSCTKLCQ